MKTGSERRQDDSGFEKRSKLAVQKRNDKVIKSPGFAVKRADVLMSPSKSAENEIFEFFVFTVTAALFVFEEDVDDGSVIPRQSEMQGAGLRYENEDES